MKNSVRICEIYHMERWDISKKKDWDSISVRLELLNAIKEYFKNHETELKLKYGIGNASALIHYWLREHLKSEEAI